MYARFGLRSVAALFAVVAVVGGCGKKGDAADDQKTGSVTSEDMRSSRADWPAGAGAQLDSGNAAFSAKNYQEALRHYQTLVDMPKANQNLKVTAYFGLYMTHSALGDTVAAKAATSKIQELAPNASLIHGNPMVADSTQAPPPQAPNDSIHRGRGQ